MKRGLFLLSLFIFSVFASHVSAQTQVPYRVEFLNFWNKFKRAVRNNDADFLFGCTQIPFDSEGAYYNTDATLDDVKENHKFIYPPYLHEMEFVRFSAVLVENADPAYVWLGYSPDDDAYFYSYKLMPVQGSENITYSEKWWFKRLPSGEFKFFRTSQDYD
ncbi:MAG: hypothetical protein IJR32_03685 [Paludibacteraceae bacterium]|nr:hypothetical protein [Paludibacteraceae bacterium]MCR4619808.1 hypothetical protein [Paludibacteraceae bacterium]